jgi:hypothetical protein
MKVVATEPLDLEESRNSVMIEPAEPLMKTKRVSVGRAVVDGKKTRTWTEIGRRLRGVQERQRQRCDASHRPAKEFQPGEEEEQIMADTGKETNAMEDVPADTCREKPSKESAEEGEGTTATEETRRCSERVRRSPVRYTAAEAAIGAVFLLMGLLAPLLGVGTAEGRHFESFNRDGVIFKYQEDIFFSDSEWVVVTDVSFTPIETALAAVRQWYVGQMRDDPRRAEAKEGERLRTQLRDRAREGLDCLEVIEGRYQVLRRALIGTTDRRKRGLVDAGGTTLQWLFGVATERDLEGVNDHLQALSKETTAIVHAVAHQASMVNDTWRELGEHALIMQQLDKAHRALEKEVNSGKSTCSRP